MQSARIELPSGTMTCLDTQKLHGAIVRGCQTLISARDDINRINVFPVADGDTGDNMASTARAVIQFSKSDCTMDAMLQSVADAGVMGAHGNSGIIFSQFLNAFSAASCADSLMDAKAFATRLETAARSVRDSLANPLEGTMITLIDVLAATFQARSADEQCFNRLMQKTLPTLNNALHLTEHQLPELEKAHVVDAGALGFYRFMEGFADYLQNPETEHHGACEHSLTASAHTHEASIPDTLPARRYCTEAILRSESIDRERLTQMLSRHGDSIALTGNARVCRFHLHTNTPWEVFPDLFGSGTLEYPKVDDMLRQYETRHARKYPIALVTDSSADLPSALFDSHQIHQIPISILYNEHTLLDRYCLEPAYLYNTLASLPKHPGTSLPSPSLIDSKFELLAREYPHVLVIALSSALSGTCETMMRLAKRYPNITVVDSGHTSGTLGLLTLNAARLIEQGCSVEEIVPKLEKARENMAIYLMVDNLDALIRSGRLGKLTGSVARMSGIRPLITIHSKGKGRVCSAAFSASNGLARLIAMVHKKSKQTGLALGRYAIVHAGAPAIAAEFANQTQEAFGFPPAFIEQVSAGVGLHAGQGALGIAVQYSE